MSAHFLSLSHFAARPVGQLERRRNQCVDAKPRGLWLSVDGDRDWESWCIAEDFNLAALAVRHRVTLRRDANVLCLSGAEQIDDFHERYAADLAPDFTLIDWRRITEAHDGIVIAPYCWPRRLKGRASRWYYGWDCASGCIWNPRAIEKIEVVADLMRETASVRAGGTA